jgi:PAS domain-containing protein
MWQSQSRTLSCSKKSRAGERRSSPNQQSSTKISSNRSAVGVLVINLSGRTANWNGALEQIDGLRREQAIGQRIGEVFEPGIPRTLREP